MDKGKGLVSDLRSELGIGDVPFRAGGSVFRAVVLSSYFAENKSSLAS